jgi:VWFA-related protein
MPSSVSGTARSIRFQAFVYLLFSFSVFCRPGNAQDLVDTRPSVREWSFKKEINEVDILFTAVHKGKPVGTLTQSGILIRDDNKPPAAVTAFRTRQELPLRVGLVIDTSDSVTSRFSFEKAAASAFLRQALTGSGDMGFVLGFSDHLRLTQDFVGDTDLLARGVERLSLDGGTALYDAVLATCQKLHDRPEQGVVARVLVVMSDGQNNAGQAKLEDAIDAAQDAGITIYAIGTNYKTYSTTDENREAELGNASLRKLAHQTGGRALFPPDPEEVGRAFRKIDEELRNRYEVSYTPADFKTDGRYRRIKIEAKASEKGLEIRARKGYFARKTSALSSKQHLMIEEDEPSKF